MYFVLHVTRVNGQTAQELFRFDTIEQARANHHYFLSSCYANESLTYALAMILSAVGDVLAREVYDRPPEQEEVE